MPDVTAPFTAEQVQILNLFQSSGAMHPFTCGRRSEHPDNEGILSATEDGWHCPVEECQYTQSWAHWFMADHEWVDSMIRSHQRLFGELQGDDDV
jgi:hypothetical protein